LDGFATKSGKVQMDFGNQKAGEKCQLQDVDETIMSKKMLPAS
jgi:hypothetical protein